MRNIAIVEDDENAAAQLVSYLERYGREQGNESYFHISLFRNGIVFLTDYKARYDIVFMDIDMPDMNGMDCSRKLRELDASVVLIFVTNMAQFAVKGYSVDALDFIVKPVTYYNFSVILRRAEERLNKTADVTVSVRTQNGFSRLRLSEIKYVEVINHQLVYHTDTGNLMSYGQLKDIEEEFTAAGFIKCNRFYLVNLRHIRSVSGDLIDVGGEILQISVRKKKEVMIAIANYFGGGVG